MFSLQTIFGKGDKFYGLLEQSAEAAHGSAKALHQMLAHKERAPVMADAASKRVAFVAAVDTVVSRPAVEQVHACPAQQHV